KFLASRLPNLARQMIRGMAEFVENCRESGLAKNEITRRRLLLHANSIHLVSLLRQHGFWKRPRLVLTSPPYPGVHVLYHRWQYRGRKETSAPYWIANVLDGAGGSYYTAGSRTPTGLRAYFSTIVRVFAAVRKVMDSDGVVVQLIGFSNAA